MWCHFSFYWSCKIGSFSLLCVVYFWQAIACPSGMFYLFLFHFFLPPFPHSPLSSLSDKIQVHRTHWFSFLNLPSLFSSFFLLSSLLLWSVLPLPSIRHFSHPASFLIYQYNHFVSFRWDWNELFSCDQKFIFLSRLPRIMNEEGPFASP